MDLATFLNNFFSASIIFPSSARAGRALLVSTTITLPWMKPETCTMSQAANTSVVGDRMVQMPIPVLGFWRAFVFSETLTLHRRT